MSLSINELQEGKWYITLNGNGKFKYKPVDYGCIKHTKWIYCKSKGEGIISNDNWWEQVVGLADMEEIYKYFPEERPPAIPKPRPFEAGKVYYVTYNSGGSFINRMNEEQKVTSYVDVAGYFYEKLFILLDINILKYRDATEEETKWLEVCEKAHRFINREEALKLWTLENTPKQEDYIGRWVKALRNGANGIGNIKANTYHKLNRKDIASVSGCYNISFDGLHTWSLHPLDSINWELMPIGFDPNKQKEENGLFDTKDREALLKEAKRRYPIGTKFRVVHKPECILTVSSHDRYELTFFQNGDYLHINFLTEENTDDGARGGTVCLDGKWAEIVEMPKNNKVEIFPGIYAGDVVVSQNNFRGRRLRGDMFKTMENSSIDSLVYDTNGYISYTPTEWRKATPEEVEHYHKGVRNINDIPGNWMMKAEKSTIDGLLKNISNASGVYSTADWYTSPSSIQVDAEIMDIKVPTSGSVTLKNTENEVKINVKTISTIKL